MSRAATATSSPFTYYPVRLIAAVMATMNNMANLPFSKGQVPIGLKLVETAQVCSMLKRETFVLHGTISQTTGIFASPTQEKVSQVPVRPQPRRSVSEKFQLIPRDAPFALPDVGALDLWNTAIFTACHNSRHNVIFGAVLSLLWKSIISSTLPLDSKRCSPPEIFASSECLTKHPR